MRHFEKQCVDTTVAGPPSSSGDNACSITDDGYVRVYSYGTPSCVDANLADHPRTQALVTSVVLHGEYNKHCG